PRDASPLACKGITRDEDDVQDHRDREESGQHPIEARVLPRRVEIPVPAPERSTVVLSHGAHDARPPRRSRRVFARRHAWRTPPIAQTLSCGALLGGYGVDWGAGGAGEGLG